MFANNTLGKMQPVKGSRMIKTSVKLGARSEDKFSSSQGRTSPLPFKDIVSCSKMSKKPLC